MIANYHTHTYLCGHAEGTVEDYVKKAIEENLKVIGISDHGPFCDDLNDIITRRMNFDEYHLIYLKELEIAKQKYEKKIQVKKGLEIEYLKKMIPFYDHFLQDLDYLILGQHLVEEDNTVIDIYRYMNSKMIGLYKESVLKGMASKKFKILAHPEIFNWAYPEWDELCQETSVAIISSAIENDVALELNANGMRRKRVINRQGEETHLYPRLEFWRLVAKTNAKVIISDDAHYLCHLNDDVTRRAQHFARDLGIVPMDEIDL